MTSTSSCPDACRAMVGTQQLFSSADERVLRPFPDGDRGIPDAFFKIHKRISAATSFDAVPAARVARSTQRRYCRGNNVQQGVDDSQGISDANDIVRGEILFAALMTESPVTRAFPSPPSRFEVKSLLPRKNSCAKN
jgi:hypothetical protein